MDKISNTLRILDLVIQFILLALVLLVAKDFFLKSASLLNVMSAEFFLGSYQVMSGVVGVLLTNRGRMWKTIYFLGIGVYYIVGGLVYMGFSLDIIVLSEIWENNICILLIVVIPITIGVVFSIMSFKDCLSKENVILKEHNDLLDYFHSNDNTSI